MTSIFLKMEGNINFWKMEDDLKLFLKMEENLIFGKM